MFPRIDKQNGYTLPEILIALTILGFILTGVASMTIQSGKTLFVSTEKLEINADIRFFTQLLASEARSANAFLIYPSSNEERRDSISDRLRDGEAGDFLALVFLEPFPTASDDEHITRIICYYRDSDDEQAGPVNRVDYTLPTPVDPSLITPESAIITTMGSGESSEIVTLARGLAGNFLFFNERDETVIVNGQIVHGNVARQVTDTYNFAVSPRG